MVRQDILDAILRTVADDGRTVIFSSHLLDEVERMSDHVTMIHGGRVALDGPRDEICAAHHVTQLRFAQRFDRLPRSTGAEGRGRRAQLGRRARHAGGSAGRGGRRGRRGDRRA